MKDDELGAVCERALRHNEEQSRRLKTQIKTAAPQALLFAQ